MGTSRNPDRPLSLCVWLTLIVDGRNFTLRALVDTGAEVNIIRTGIIRRDSLEHDSHPLTLKGADDSCLKGGHLCVRGTSEVVGNDISSQQDIVYNAHFTCMRPTLRFNQLSPINGWRIRIS